MKNHHTYHQRRVEKSNLERGGGNRVQSRTKLTGIEFHETTKMNSTLYVVFFAEIIDFSTKNRVIQIKIFTCGADRRRKRKNWKIKISTILKRILR